MNNSFFITLLLFLSYFSSVTAQTEPFSLRLADFTHQKIAPGLHWYQLLPQQLPGSTQSINLLRIQTRRRAVDLLYQPDTLITTSIYAATAKAKAAVNAGFFNMQQGGSVSYLKKNGQVLAQNQPDLQARNSVVIRGAFCVSTSGQVRIGSPENTNAYTNDPTIDDVLFSGPLLIENGQAIPLDSTAFVLDRHPRTCACLTRKNQLLLLTIDGRHPEAQGLSLPELTDLLLDLKCKSAINLDGGGSTTMYIQGQPAEGIVNFPSDNRTFDHQGQRKVANVIVVY